MKNILNQLTCHFKGHYFNRNTHVADVVSSHKTKDGLDVRIKIKDFAPCSRCGDDQPIKDIYGQGLLG